jgi:Protein of unknown function (DUF4236)
MSLRFRRRLLLFPGASVNLSKRGASLRRGLTTNIGRKGVRETIGLPGSGLGYQYLEYHGWNTRQKSSLDFTSSPHSVSSAFAQPRTHQAVKVAEWHEYTVGRQVRFKTPRVLMVAPREPVFTRTAVFQARMKVHAPRRTDSSYQNRNSVVRSYSADSSGRKTLYSRGTVLSFPKDFLCFLNTVLNLAVSRLRNRLRSGVLLHHPRNFTGLPFAG